MYGEGDDKLNYITPEECAWPPLPPRPASTVCDSALDGLSTRWMAPYGYSLTLTRSPSFAQTFEEEISKCETSLSSTYTHTQGDETLVEDDNAGTPEHPTTIADHVQRHRGRMFSLTASSSSSNGLLTQPSSPAETNPRIRFSGIETPQANSIENLPEEDTNREEDNRALLSPTPNQDSRSGTPTSPNTMNKLNERDPAFQRTVKALRSVKNTANQAARPKIRPVSFASPSSSKIDSVTSPARCQTSFETHQQSDGTKKRYTTFFNKLRGRVLSS